MRIFSAIKEDISTVFHKDPAARSLLEVLFCYPGLHAIWMYRISHFFWKHKLYFIARILSHISRFFTGIEIHPAATIGRRFFIDHGMGVVIGETTEIGDDVLIYKGVVLGGTSLEKKKRHPTIGNNVIIGTNAIVLGALTIGDNVIVAASSVVTHNIPSNALAIGIPARIKLGNNQEEITHLDHSKLPDPVSDAIKLVLREQKKLEEKFNQIMKTQKQSD